MRGDSVRITAQFSMPWSWLWSSIMEGSPREAGKRLVERFAARMAMYFVGTAMNEQEIVEVVSALNESLVVELVALTADAFNVPCLL